VVRDPLTAGAAAIRLEGVTKTFSGTPQPAVASLGLTVPEGGITVRPGRAVGDADVIAADFIGDNGLG
jgi:hypothetical protein